MPVFQHKTSFQRLSTQVLDAWRDAEAAPVSDCLNRAHAMDAGISPLSPGMHVVGQARTVRCQVGDNSAIHAAINLVEPGDVLVASAGGFLGTAVWGGLMTESARKRGIAGLVIDGAVRDFTDIVEVGFPCFARGVTPAGPHKNFGGEIDGPIACGGIAVNSGDLVVADADGVTIVPLARVEDTLTAYRALKEREMRTLNAIGDGGTLAKIYGVPEIIRMEPDGE